MFIFSELTNFSFLIYRYKNMEINYTVEGLRQQSEIYKTVEKVARQTTFIKYRDSNAWQLNSLYVQIFKDCEAQTREAKSQGKSNEEIIEMIEKIMQRHL